MNKFVLKRIEPENDSQFLNNCEIPFEVYSKDDVWFLDVLSGGRILHSSDMIIFDVKTEYDCLALKLRFGDRVRDYLSWE